MPYTNSIVGNEPVKYDNNTKAKTSKEALNEFKDSLIKSAVESLFSTNKTEEIPKTKEETKETSLFDSFVEECIVQPTSEIIVEEGKNYFASLFASAMNNNS